MRKTLALLCALSALTAVACSHGAMAVDPNSGDIIVARNDGFLFGALRKIYKCTPDGAGNWSCSQMSGKP